MATLPGFGQIPKPPNQPRTYPGYTQEQVAASLAANPNAAGMPGGTAPYFQGGYTADFSGLPGPTGPGGSYRGGGGGGGTTQFTPPDYAALIASDPAYLQLQQSLSAGGIANAAQRAAATQRALIAFGLVPDFQHSATSMGLTPQALGFLSQDITPDITALANQNTQNGLSTEARVNQAHSRAIMALRNALAARGALSSGEANYQLNNQEQAYQQSQQDLVGKLLDAISGYQGQYLSAQQQAQQQQAQALTDAYTRQIQAFVQGGGFNGAGGGGQQTYSEPAPAPTPYTPPAPAPAPVPYMPPPAPAPARAPAPYVGSYVGIPAANAAAGQAGRLERINSMM